MQNFLYDPRHVRHTLYESGIIALPSALDPALIDKVKLEVDALYEDALRRERGALNRGPNRHYVEISPEQLTTDMFREIMIHPWVELTCKAMFGDIYKVVEFGFDTVGPNSADQPFHRDYRTPASVLKERKIHAIAINIPLVDVTLENGPFEYVPGTQFDLPENFDELMFPPKELNSEYEKKAVRKVFVSRGSMSARDPNMIHRGTENRSNEWRPVMVVGIDGEKGTNAPRHDMQVTKSYFESLPRSIREHLACRVVEKIEHIRQAHEIAGLRMA